VLPELAFIFSILEPLRYCLAASMCPRVGGVCFEHLFVQPLIVHSIHLYEARGIEDSELVPNANQVPPVSLGVDQL